MPPSVRISTMMAPISCEKGPKERQRRGSKSEVNLGAARWKVPPRLMERSTGHTRTDTIFCLGAASSADAPSAVINDRREIGIVETSRLEYHCKSTQTCAFASCSLLLPFHAPPPIVYHSAGSVCAA